MPSRRTLISDPYDAASVGGAGVVAGPWHMR